MKKILSFIIILTLSLSFTAFASDFECVETNIPNNAPASYIGDNVISLTFSEEVDPGSIISTPVTKDGNALGVTDYDVYYGDDYNIVEIEIYELDYGSTYVIDYGNYSYDSTLVVNNPATLTFTVEEAPEVIIGNPDLISGLETGTITTIPYEPTGGNEVTAETLTGWMIDVENGASFDKEITLVCALYDDNGLLKKIVTSSKTVLAGTTDQVAVGTYIPSETDAYVDDTEGNVDFNMAKIFVWDNMEDKSPYVAAYSYDIVAPTP